MALYFYQAFTREGKNIKGQLDAPSHSAARELLQRKNLLPIKIIPAYQVQHGESFLQSLFSRSVSLKEKILFTKQLAVLLRSGIPLLQSIELLQEQFEGRLHRILITIKDGLKEGQSLADGLKQYPGVFENIYVQLVRAGQASGHLDTILERLTQYLERRDALQKKISGALMLPAIQLFLVVLIVIGLMIGVVPKLASVFISQGQSLPLPTQILMSGSSFLTEHFIVLGLSVVTLVMSFLYWKSTITGGLTLDRLRLKLPIVNRFARLGAIVQFSKTLGMLLEGGVNLSQALDIVCNIVDNRVLKSALEEAREKIIKEGKIAEYLKQTKIFPSMATYLIKTGEESGTLDEMLLSVGKTYEDDLSELADTLTPLLQPFITIFMAIVVGFIVMAIAMPIMNLGQAI